MTTISLDILSDEVFLFYLGFKIKNNKKLGMPEIWMYQLTIQICYLVNAQY